MAQCSCVTTVSLPVERPWELRLRWGLHQLSQSLNIYIFKGLKFELNPGLTLNMCTLNIRSLNLDHSIYLTDILHDNNCDVVALTETWLSSNKHSASELATLTPSGYELSSCPRHTGNGGGVAFLVRQPLSYTVDTYSFSSFEALKLHYSKLSVLNIYRPPDSSSTSQSFSFSTFLAEFDSVLSVFATLPNPFVITGDFNIHVDYLSHVHSSLFRSLLSLTNLTQHVNFPAHCHNHTLGLVITASATSLNPSISFSPLSISDHLPVFTSLTVGSSLPPPPSPLERTFVACQPLISTRSLLTSHHLP